MKPPTARWSASIRAALGLPYERPNWCAEWAASFAERKDRQPVGEPANGVSARSEAPGYSTVDLHTDWKPLDHPEVFVALINITDRACWNWGLASALRATSVTLDCVTAPGCANGIGLRATF